jgi:1-acyl-sn-glycerol-3-phosphate acyltransferase
MIPKGHRQLVVDAIAECEKKGTYNVHVDPISYDDCYPVDEKYPFIRSPKEKVVDGIAELTKIKPFILFDTVHNQHLKVYGRKNLKGIKSAVITCNHVYMFDCLACIRALRGHKAYVTAADFNNLKGELGDMMRKGGMLPISMKNLKALRKFEEAVDYYLQHKKYVVFFPEQAMWRYYKKPRPFKNGAFHFASKNNVPVIPIYICFRDSGQKDEEGFPIMYSSLYIMKPIYPKKDLDEKANIDYLRKTDFQMCVDKYESFYKEKYKLDNYNGEF